MRAIERILDQLNRAWGGPSWTGVDIRSLLDGVTDDQARAHPLPDVHSIIELVMHMSVWMDVVAVRLAGDAKELTAEEDWRDVTHLPWSQAIEEMENAVSRLSDAIARLSVDDLDRIVAGRDYTTYVMVHGVIQHALYHAGQIAVLKRVSGVGGRGSES
ncbi:MAG TPA: DinB family protein [Thermoanaerobaculia bacterium]|nr:DinB family protein [Thermoanaerobaculia bacterium]